MKLYIESGVSGGNAVTLSVRCPGCRQIGTFEIIGNDSGFVSKGVATQVGDRRCPNPSCKLHMFVVFQNNKLRASYPAERIDFD
jgi:hypothetical protein